MCWCWVFLEINQSINRASRATNESTKASRTWLGPITCTTYPITSIKNFAGCAMINSVQNKYWFHERRQGGTLILSSKSPTRDASVRIVRFFDMPILINPLAFRIYLNHHSRMTSPTKQQAGDAPTVPRSIPSHPASASGARYCRSQRGLSHGAWNVGMVRLSMSE